MRSLRVNQMPCVLNTVATNDMMSFPPESSCKRAICFIVDQQNFLYFYSSWPFIDALLDEGM